MDEELSLAVTSSRARQRIYAEVGYLSAEAVAIAALLDPLWAAMGVTDGQARLRLVRRVQSRVYARLDNEATLPLGELAVHETWAMLDEWLRLALDDAEGPPADLLSARAALLGGVIPEWYEAVTRPPVPEYAALLRREMPRALPAERGLPMPVASIRLRRFRPFHWLMRLLGLTRATHPSA